MAELRVATQAQLLKPHTGAVSLVHLKSVRPSPPRRCSPRGVRLLARAGPLDIPKLDEERYESMLYRRNVFTEDDWKRHRSSSRHFRHISSIIDSRVIWSLCPPVIFMTGVASLITAWDTAVINKWLPASAPLLHMNPLPFSLCAPAFAFLLVFRTNTSYSRFNEARVLWGGTLNILRDTARLGLSYVARGPNEHQKGKQRQFLRHLTAFAYCLQYHLVKEGNLEVTLKENTTMTQGEIDAVMAANHKPNYVIQVMSKTLSDCDIQSAQRISIDANLTSFANFTGACERIFKTPIPLSYTRLTSRFLVLWHCFLPFALWDACNWLTIPAVAMSSAFLFCIEEVGVLIEEPFSLLALGAIANTASTNISELIALDESISQQIVPDDYEVENTNNRYKANAMYR